MAEAREKKTQWVHSLWKYLIADALFLNAFPLLGLAINVFLLVMVSDLKKNCVHHLHFMHSGTLTTVCCLRA